MGSAKSRAYLAVLVAVVSVLLALPAGAVSQDPGPQQPMDVPKTSTVNGGQNNGEIWVISNIVGHFEHHFPPNASFQVTEQRIKDAEGVPLNDERSAPNYISISIGGVKKDGPPNGTGCQDHEWWGWWMGAQGSYDWEASLAGRGALPGYYRITIEWRPYSGYPPSVKTLERGFNVMRLQPVVFRFKDQYGNFATSNAGFDVNQLEPYVTTLGHVDGSSSTLTKDMAPGPYKLVIPDNTEWLGRYIDFNVPEPSQTPQLYFVDVVITRKAATVDGTLGGLKVKTVDKATGAVIAGATVNFRGQTGTTDANGYVEWVNQPEGRYPVTIGKAGYHPGSVEVSIGGYLTTNIIVRLSPSSGPEQPPEIDTPLSDVNLGFLEKLLKPDPDTVDKWANLIGQMRAWGPFGAVNQFWAAWSGAARAGVADPKFEAVFQPAGAGMGEWKLIIDLREWKETPYADGGFGTPIGTVRHYFRSVLGMVTWVLFFAAVVRWAREYQF